MPRGAALLAGVIPFLPLAPPAPKLAGLPACTASALRASVSLQGATGSQLGGLALRNVAHQTCVLARPRRLVLRDRGRRLALTQAAEAPRLGARRLRLDPGRAATLELQLWNACDEHSRAHLWIVVGTGAVDLGIGAEGRCDSPGHPPSYWLGAMQSGGPPRLSPAQRRLHALRVASLDVPARARHGTVLAYRVTIANRSGAVLPARPCPVFAEQVWLWRVHAVLTRQYVLNCRALPAHGSLTFEMRMPLPRDARGDATVEWSLEDEPAPIPVRAPPDEVLNSSVSIASYSWRAFDGLRIS
jgi:Domain of unknown function (DUF4232)